MLQKLNCYQLRNVVLKFVLGVKELYIVEGCACPIFLGNEERKVSLFVCAVSLRKSYWSMHMLNEAENESVSER